MCVAAALLHHARTHTERACEAGNNVTADKLFKRIADEMNTKFGSNYASTRLRKRWDVVLASARVRPAARLDALKLHITAINARRSTLTNSARAARGACRFLPHCACWTKATWSTSQPVAT